MNDYPDYEVDEAGVHWAWGRPDTCPWCDSTDPAKLGPRLHLVNRCHNPWHKLAQIPPKPKTLSALVEMARHAPLCTVHSEGGLWCNHTVEWFLLRLQEEGLISVEPEDGNTRCHKCGGDLGGNSYWCPPCSGAMILTPPRK